MPTAAKKTRFAKLTTDEESGAFVLTLREQKDRKDLSTHYRLERNPNEDRAWRLHKLVHQDEEPVLYDVCLDGFPTCDCRGEEYLRARRTETADGAVHCKHIAALRALIAAGRLA